MYIYVYIGPIVLVFFIFTLPIDHMHSVPWCCNNYWTKVTVDVTNFSREDVHFEDQMYSFKLLHPAMHLLKLSN